MAKLTLSSLTSSYRSNAALNANFDAIEAAIENTLSRDGTSPNAMAANFDMGSNRVINLLDPTSAQDGATKAYVDGVVDTIADINAITHVDGVFIVSDGTDWVGESGATARASLGVSIGSDVQAYDADLTVFGDNPLTAAELTQLQNIDTTTVSSAQWGYLGSASAFGGSLIDDATAGDARTTLGLGTISTQDANSVDIDGGAIDGTPIGAVSASTGAFTTLSASGDTSIDGDITIQTKFVMVESPGTGVDSVSAIHAARDAVGVGGTIMLAPGQDYEIASDIAMNVAGQTLLVPAGASITSQTPATGDRIRVTADDCIIMGSGELVSVSILAGDYAAVGAAEGFRILGQGFTIKNPLTRAVNVVDSYGDKPIEIIGVRVYWDASGVTNSKSALSLAFNIETYDASATGDNLLIRDCEIDWSAWTQEDLAEVLYPLSSGAPNNIGFRISANGNTIWEKARIENCRGVMPLATQGSPSWDPVTYGNAADGVGQRRPTLFEITADRSTMTYSGKTGTFSSTETVTGGTSGATCIVDTDGSTSFTFYSRSGAFEPGETVTGGTSGATATFVNEEGNFRDLQFVNNKAIGGDLGFSMGGIGKCLFTGNFAEGQTSYPLEFASSSIITGSGNHYGGYQAGKALSCTNTTIVNLSGEYIEAGENTGFGAANTGVTLEGVGRMNLSGTIKAGANNISLIKIRTAGGADPEINFSGLSFLGEEFTGLKAIHVDQGTVNSLIVNGCTFRDIDTNSIIVDAGTTVTNLITTNNFGEGAAAFTNDGTITNHISSGNLGISGLGEVATNVSDPQAPVHVAGTAGQVYIEETDAGVDAKVWTLQAQNEVLSVQSRNDDYTFGSTLFRLNRDAQLEQPLGAVGTPAYAFQGDLDTGWYSPGADQAALATGGVDAISVNASQLVTMGSVDINGGNIDGTDIGASSRANGYFSGFGVGTSSPLGTAEVYSTGNTAFNLTSTFTNTTSTGFYINTSGDNAVARFGFSKWNGSSYVSRGVFVFRHASSGANEAFAINVAGGSDKFVVEGSGHVGLNNSSPAYACDAGGDANVTGVYRVGGTQVVSNQGAAVSDTTITYTTNDPAITPDDAVTIADGSAPTNSELLELCVELKNQIETLKSRLETHGLIA